MSEALFSHIFKRLAVDTTDYEFKEFFLDNYWSCYIDELGLLEPELNFVFNDIQYSGVNICIAGKSSAMDSQALHLAEEVFSALPVNLSLIENINIDDWSLSSLLFPYQFESRFWYAIFISEYGETKEYAFTKKANGQFSCHSMWSRKDGSIYCVLPNVRYVYDELISFNLDNKKLVKISELIAKNKTIGLELILPLLKLIEESKAKLGNNYEHLKSFLKVIEHHATIT